MHEAALAEATVERGFELYLELREAGDEGADGALEMLLRWLEGRRLTDRADEPDLRLWAAEDALDFFGDTVWSMHRYHAQAVLALPPGHEERDVPEAVDELSWTLGVARSEEDADEAVLTIGALLGADAGDALPILPLVTWCKGK